MHITDILLVAFWLPSRVTAFCSPPASWPKEPFTNAFRATSNSLTQIQYAEVTVPELHKTADIFMISTDAFNEYMSFNGHVALHTKTLAFSDSTANSSDTTCPFDSTVQSSFRSDIRYWSFYQLLRDIYYAHGALHYELVDTNSTIRGMPVNHARVCFPKRQVLMDLYYSTYTGNGVRISIAGTGFPTIYYDFMFTQREVTRQIPQGVICKDIYPATANQLPADYASFSAAVVMVYADNKFSTFREEFYDDETKLASSSLLVLPGTTFHRRFGHSFMRVIRDYKTDLRYVIDVNGGNCTVESMAGVTPSYAVAGPWDPAGVNADKSPGLFDLSAFGEFYYQEQIKLRGHSVNVYKASRTDWPRKGANTTVELYYTSVTWLTAGMLPENQAALIRFDKWYTFSGGRSKLFGFSYESTAEPRSTDELIPNSTHVIAYEEGVDDFSVYDISACYEQPKQTRRFVFSLPECYSGLVRYRPTLFEKSLRAYIAREAGIEVIRVGELEVVLSSSNVVDIWVTLFDIPNVTGGLPKSVSRVTLDEAVSKLKDIIGTRPIVVAYKEGAQSITAIPGSFRTGDDALSFLAFVAEKSKGHSTGLMAAVGASALCVGLVIGLAAPVWVWKRSQSPFLVQ